MADNKYDDYLKKYYRRLHARTMMENTNVVARLLDEKEKGLLTAEQEAWFTDFLEPDPNQPGKYRAKPLPDPRNEDEILLSELKDKIFKAMSLTLSDLKSHSKSDWRRDREPDIFGFIDKWMGGEKPFFSLPDATDQCKASIQNLFNFLKNSDRAESIKQYIVENTTKISDSNSKQFDNIPDLNKFIRENTTEHPKYETDTKARDKLKQIARALEQCADYYGSNTERLADQQALNDSNSGIIKDLSVITNEDAFSNINTTRFDDFITRDPNTGVAPIDEFLDTLYSNKDIREKYKKYDGLYKITEKIEKAESRIPWQDSKSANYIKPKIEDVRNPWQQLKKWTADTYRDTIDKYKELRSIPEFKSPHAKELFKQIDKLGIKPADGLNTLLDKSGDVKKKLSDKTVEQHFDWFVETMNAIKEEIPNAIDGAWRNAEQMKCVIEQIILKATDPYQNDPDAVAKAKTAMEIMTAMKYGMLTSKTMDTLKQADFTIFSDKDLSWNKNESIKFLTSAFDKSVKAAFMGIGYAVTFIGNNYFLSGRTFSGKDNQTGFLSKAFRREEDRVARNTVFKSQQDIQQSIDNIKQQKANNLANLNVSDAKDITKSIETLEKKQEQILEQDNFKKLKKDMDDAEIRKSQFAGLKEEYAKKMESLQQDKDKYIESKKIVYKEDEKKLKKDIENQEELIKSLEAEKAKETDADVQKSLGDQIAQHKIERVKTEKQLRDLEQQDRDTNSERYKNIKEAEKTFNETSHSYTDYLGAEQDYETTNLEYEKAEQQFQNAKKNYDDEKEKNSEYQNATNKIDRFKNAETNITELDKTIKAMEKSKAIWDNEHNHKVFELQKYWNELQGQTPEQTNLLLNMYAQAGRLAA